ncbi:hypothetical protein Moror_14879 [Moniliophthora roreri MCA 2997]|uniref:Uncharacterized protein n=1 Tax=Moniliophthora roreri (strain MCA 2997) TaxID=1381753 RepID=V2WHW9_MONRO|nr:hypothetical protein Moror_14879 [Moniliophthora roreri MCA 2997]
MELEAIHEQLEMEEQEANLLQVELSISSTPNSRPMSTNSSNTPPPNPMSPEPLRGQSNSPVSPHQLPRPQCLTPPSSQSSTPLLPVCKIPLDEWSPPMNSNPPLMPSLPPLYPSIQTRIASTVSVWDVKDKEADDRDSLQNIRSRPPMPHPEAQMAEVYETLNALCATWVNTVPSTAQTTVV